MTITDLLHFILQRLDLDSTEALVVTADETLLWPTESLDLLMKWGLLTPIKPRTHLLCEGCEEQCIMPVEVIPKSEKKGERAFIACDKREEIDIVPVELERLRQWKIDPAQIAGSLSKLLEIAETPQMLIQGRLWRLGRTEMAGSRHEVFWGRGLNWTDAGIVAKKLEHHPTSLKLFVFAATALKSESALVPRPIVPLMQVFLVDQSQLLLDRELIANFLAPKAKGRLSANDKATDHSLSPLKHSPDFRSVTLNDVTYTLSSKQAQVLQILTEAHSNEAPDVGTDYILEQIGSMGSRLRDVFKQNKEAWKALIISMKRGTVRLKL